MPFYAFGQVSRFISQGSVRIGHTVHGLEEEKPRYSHSEEGKSGKSKSEKPGAPFNLPFLKPVLATAEKAQGAVIGALTSVINAKDRYIDTLISAPTGQVEVFSARRPDGALVVVMLNNDEKALKVSLTSA